MSIQRVKFNVYLRKDKKNKKGEMPIAIRFSRINGVEPKFSLGLSVTQDMWDADRGCILGDDDLILQKEINRIREELRTLQISNEEITKAVLEEVVTHRSLKASNPANRSFCAYMEEYVAKSVKNGKMRESTAKGYDTTLASLREFRKEILVSEISATLLNKFKEFLYCRGRKSGKGMVDGSVSNSLKRIRATIKYLERLNISVDNPFLTLDVTIPEDNVNDVFLEENELESMRKLLDKLQPCTTEKSVLLRYLFSCYTGLRIGDSLNLKWDDLKIEGENESPTVDIAIIMQKSNTSLRTPLSKDAEKIMCLRAEEVWDKLDSEDEEFVFPQMSPTAINTHLKKLAKRAGIDKDISFHSSRRTFATLAKAKGIGTEDIGTMMGHKNPTMTLRYAKNSDANRERLRKLINSK